MVKNFIFDLDGTLIHSSPGIIFSFNKAYEQIFKCEPHFSIEKQIGPPVSQMLMQNRPETTAGQLKDFVAIFQNVYDTSGYKNTLAYEAVQETIKSLFEKGYPLFIATNKREAPTLSILKLLGMLQYFKDVYCIDSHNQIFSTKSLMVQHLINGWKLDNKETILIGDTRHDYKAAIDNAIRFIFAKYGYATNESYEESIASIISVQNFITQ